MKFLKVLTTVCCVVMMLGILLPVAQADVWNQKTELTFNKPVQVPGAVLPAGTYWFVLENSEGPRNIVQIFSKNYSTLYATALSVPTIRSESNDNTVIKFAERPHNQPDAILKWYYPGLLTGHEFLYPKREEHQVALETKLDVTARPINQTSSMVPVPGA
jgi:hypothetical protein